MEDIRVSDRAGGGDNVAVLLAAAQAGDDQALGRLTEKYRWYLTQAANGELPADVRVKVAPSDLVQETFLQVKANLPQFRGSTERELRAWLRQILLNNVGRAIRMYRGTDKRDVAREFALYGLSPGREPTLASTDESPSKHAVAKESAQLVADAFTRLPDHYREIITLRNVERRSFVEIGTLTGRTAAAARQTWVRAIEHLRRELREIDDS